MPRKVSLNTGSKAERTITADLGSAKMKRLLFNIAKNRGSTLTDFIRTTFFKIIEDAPAHQKINRHTDEEDVD